MKSLHNFLVPILLLTATLAGCGGGGSSSNTQPSSGNNEPTVTGLVSLDSLEPGMCADVVDETNGIEYLDVKSCSESHQYEFAGLASLEALGVDYPEGLLIDRVSHQECRAVFESHTGQSYNGMGLGIETIVPTISNWDDGDYSVLCLVVNADRSPLTASVAM